jgi:hypothetical protein
VPSAEHDRASHCRLRGRKTTIPAMLSVHTPHPRSRARVGILA